MRRQFGLITLVSVVMWLIPLTSHLRADSDGFEVDQQDQKLVITRAGKPVTEFVFRNDKILRPYFANVYSPNGVLLTRNSPPIKGVDPVDHETMHPGIWLAFGDINGSDFWRNQGEIRHDRFRQPPEIRGNRLSFATDSQLTTADAKRMCELVNRFELSNLPNGTLLVWEATFSSDTGDFTFGDQEEMGFGARLATPLIEKNGGSIVSSTGTQTARKTWGQPARWCDYGKHIDGRNCGITLMTHPANFRESWWHNRDYGLFVANPFGRAAMKQGEKSTVTVERGSPFTIKFAAMLHDSKDYDPEASFRQFIELHP